MDALIEIESRADGFYSRFNAEFLEEPRPWIGPYPTEEAAEEAASNALTQVMADFAKIMLGLT